MTVHSVHSVSLCGEVRLKRHIFCMHSVCSLKDRFHKSQNAPVPYPTMLHSEQKCAHFCTVLSIVGYGTGIFWDLWIRPIGETLMSTHIHRKNHVHVSHCVDEDIIKWKHFPRPWPFVRGIQRSPLNSPHKGQWRRALMFSLICAWTNGWVSNRDTGD